MCIVLMSKHQVAYCATHSSWMEKLTIQNRKQNFVLPVKSPGIGHFFHKVANAPPWGSWSKSQR